jgi:hypothetical protein
MPLLAKMPIPAVLGNNRSERYCAKILKSTGDPMEPSEAQLKAGNYKKTHWRIHGMDIAIENLAGTTRKGVDPEGKAWEVTMPYHYGYIKGTTGADGDHLDVAIGPLHDGGKEAHIFNQTSPDGDFDEHKIFVGFSSREAAIDAYRMGRSDNPEDVMGTVITVPIEEFKRWLDEGSFKKQTILKAEGGFAKAIGGVAHIKAHYRNVNGKIVYIEGYDKDVHGDHPEAALHERTVKHVDSKGAHFLRATDKEDAETIEAKAKELGITPHHHATRGKYIKSNHHGRTSTYPTFYFDSEQDAQKVHDALKPGGEVGALPGAFAEPEKPSKHDLSMQAFAAGQEAMKEPKTKEKHLAAAEANKKAAEAFGGGTTAEEMEYNMVQSQGHASDMAMHQQLAAKMDAEAEQAKASAKKKTFHAFMKNMPGWALGKGQDDTYFKLAATQDGKAIMGSVRITSSGVKAIGTYRTTDSHGAAISIKGLDEVHENTQSAIGALEQYAKGHGSTFHEPAKQADKGEPGADKGPAEETPDQKFLKRAEEFKDELEQAKSPDAAFQMMKSLLEDASLALPGAKSDGPIMKAKVLLADRLVAMDYQVKAIFAMMKKGGAPGEVLLAAHRLLSGCRDFKELAETRNFLRAYQEARDGAPEHESPKEGMKAKGEYVKGLRDAITPENTDLLEKVDSRSYAPDNGKAFDLMVGLVNSVATETANKAMNDITQGIVGTKFAMKEHKDTHGYHKDTSGFDLLTTFHQMAADFHEGAGYPEAAGNVKEDIQTVAAMKAHALKFKDYAEKDPEGIASDAEAYSNAGWSAKAAHHYKLAAIAAGHKAQAEAGKKIAHNQTVNEWWEKSAKYAKLAQDHA